jgi:HEAT repeat protein
MSRLKSIMIGILELPLIVLILIFRIISFPFRPMIIPFQNIMDFTLDIFKECRDFILSKYHKYHISKIKKLALNKNSSELIRALSNEHYNHPYIRIQIIKSLGEIGEKAAIESLTEIYTNNPSSDFDTLEAIIISLGQIGGRGAEETLTRILRYAQLRELFRFIDLVQKNFIKIINKNSIELLKTMLNDDHWAVRNMAFEGLVKINDISTWPFIYDALNGESERSAARSLDLIGWKPSNVDEKVRYLLAEGGSSSINKIISIGEKAVEILITFLEHKNKNLRYGAVKALGDIGDNRAVEPLISNLRKRLPNSKANSLQRLLLPEVIALCQIGDKRAAEPLLEYLIKNPSYYQDSKSGDDSFADRDTMCATYENLSNIFGQYTTLIADIVTLRVEVISSMEVFYHTDYKYDNAKAETSVLELCCINTKISDNILNLLRLLKDTEFPSYYSTTYYGDGYNYKIISFDKIRKMATEELENRGNPSFEPSVFLIEEEWKY